MTAPTTVVLFGATGDLAKRKLIPGLLHLFQSRLVDDLRVVGTSLDEHVRRRASATSRWSPSASTAPARWGTPTGTSSRSASTSCRCRPARWPWARPSRRAEALLPGEVNQRLHYLSVPPEGRARRGAHHRRGRPRRAQPGGHGEAVRHRLRLAVALNAQLHEVFDEEQIFRIDHFLGKEPAQNILAFRFANGLFEPIWHRNNISHIEIDVPETLGLTQRGDFYEATGAYRDMVVTHLFQILAFTAMEPPTSLEPAAISREKNKVFRSMQPIQPTDVVRGQYTGYHDEPGVRPDSETETFVALKCFVDNWRWAGRAVLPAHRQADGRGRPDHLDRLPRAPAVDVPAGLGRRRQRPRPPHLRPRRQVADVVVVLREAPGPRVPPRQAVDAVLDAGDELGRRRPRGVRAAHLRRGAR